MQQTSRAYKTEQKNHFRNEQFVYVYLGVISREAQANAQAGGTFAVYSDEESIYGSPNFEAYYATCEENFSKVDNSMFFMPRDRNAFALYQGLVTEKMCDSVTFDFGTFKHLNIKGLTIDFGDYYPTKFTVTNGTMKYTYEYTNNKPGKWSTEDEFLDSSIIRITPTEMSGGEQRLRIISIMFGFGLQFDNSSLISTTWNSEVAHLSDVLPVKTFSFTVDNSSRVFSADNPSSYMAYLEEQQEVMFDYGRMMDDGTIYRIPGGKLNLKSWSSNDTEAKFNAVGYLDYSTGTYLKGKFYPNGISLYDLAVDICEDAGYPLYKIDTYLKKIIVHNPLPVERHKALLQLIANAAMAVIMESRKGEVTIVTSFEPDIQEVTTSGETAYSMCENIVKPNSFVEYADVEPDFVYADGHQYFLPREADQLNTGYISERAANEEGVFYAQSENYIHFVYAGGTIDGILFEDIKYGKFIGGGEVFDLNENSMDNPTLTVVWENDWTFFNMGVEFSDAFPEAFIIHCYNEGTEVDTIVVDEDLDFVTNVQHDFYDVDTLTFEFVKTNPGQRIHVGKLTFGSTVDYTLDYRDMAATPVATRTEFIKNVNVVYTKFAYGTTKKTISTVDIVEGTNTVELSNACHDYSLAYEELTDDTEGYTKVRKVFCDALPTLDVAETSVRYFVRRTSGYDMYVCTVSNDVKSWTSMGRVTETIVNSLPSTLSTNVLYLVKTSTDLIYHLYMKSDGETISLGYDVRGTLTILDSAAYFVKFTSNVASPVVISGIEFVISEKTFTTSLNDVGVDKTSRNVLIDTVEHAEKEAQWLKGYYTNDVEYTIKYRGEPALDPDDLIYIENKFVEKNLVRITDSQIDTSTGMSMNCVLHARRVSYAE